ncbi:MAG TPA: hypothetical protein VEB18_00840 [Candidatus Paceibacterota bacterium]|nr:hypothetical protein [Candidatus Paceibacterota bacterium]
MTVASLIAQFLSEPVLYPLLKEPELESIAKREPASLLSPADIAKVLALFDRIESVLDTEEKKLSRYEAELVAMQ